MSTHTIARATARIACARELLAQTRARLGDTRTLIALNRRWLNPWWGLSGSSEHDGERALLQSVLDRLQRRVKSAPSAGRLSTLTRLRTK